MDNLVLSRLLGTHTVTRLRSGPIIGVAVRQAVRWNLASYRAPDPAHSVFFWIAAWPEWPGKISTVLMFTISRRP